MHSRAIGLGGAVTLIACATVSADPNCTEAPLPSDDFTGRGVLVTWDCARFEGEFVRGQLRKGRLSFADGSMREGNFVDGVLSGPGKEREADGTLREGNFVRGGLQGEARFTYADGRVYEGATVYGRADGLGRVTYPDGTVERGYYTPAGLIGQAVRTLPDESRTVGEYREGKPFGTHVLARKDGTGEVQHYAWGGQRVAQLDEGPAGAAAAPDTAGDRDAPADGTKEKKKKKKSDVADEVNRAVRGLKDILGGG